ncbi:hypothetical protein OPV22_010300 [Ensete ventricosum]|uniref:Uncharacterized protein n=1 Tax=Ensete ventricosum TaxID=4639 RepID=A0AAV8R753_ENSVE|nr:hypothetical protein OPV22_010300 [Ensete ventricosum]
MEGQILHDFAGKILSVLVQRPSPPGSKEDFEADWEKHQSRVCSIIGTLKRLLLFCLKHSPSFYRQSIISTIGPHYISTEICFIFWSEHKIRRSVMRHVRPKSNMKS